MTIVAYRMAGFTSLKSSLYLEALLLNGWTERQIEHFRKDLPVFESACVQDTFEVALSVFATPPEEVHHVFLKELVEYVKVRANAARYEELLRKATSENHKDSIAANVILGTPNLKTDDLGEGESGTAEIHFHVKERKSSVNVTRGKAKITTE